MKKMMRRLLTIFTIIFGFVISSNVVHAKELDPNDYVTSVQVSPSTFTNGQQISVLYDWKDSEDNPIKSGDTMYIPFPESDVWVQGYTSSQILKVSGEPVANMQVDHDGITITFLDAINNMQPSTVSGTIKAYASVYTDMGSSSSVNKTISFLPDSNSSDGTSSSKGDVNVKITGNVVGSGYQVLDTSKPYVSKTAGSNTDNVENWDVQICVTDLKDSTFTDNPGTDLSINEDSLKFYTVGASNSECGLHSGESYTLSDLKDKGLVTEDSGVENNTIVLHFDTSKLQNIILGLSYTTNSADNSEVPTYTNKAQLVGTEEDDTPFSQSSIATKQNMNASGTITGINKAEIKIQKVSANTMKSLPGAVFEYSTSQNFDNSKTITTNSSGVADITGLSDGTYYIKEKQAPQGYSLNDDVYKFTVSNGVAGSLQTLSGGTLSNIIYDQQDVEFSFKKVDQNNDPVEGAIFKLTSDSGNSYSAISDANGNVKFTGLSDGNYSLEEEYAPEGYKINSTKYTVTIENGKVTTDLVDNEVINNKIVSSSSSSSSLVVMPSSSSSSSEILSSSSSKKSSSSSEISSSSSSKKSSSSSEISSSSSSKKSSSSSEISSSSSSKKSSSSSEISSSSSSEKSSSSSEVSNSNIVNINSHKRGSGNSGIVSSSSSNEASSSSSEEVSSSSSEVALSSSNNEATNSSSEEVSSSSSEIDSSSSNNETSSSSSKEVSSSSSEVALPSSNNEITNSSSEETSSSSSETYLLPRNNEISNSSSEKMNSSKQVTGAVVANNNHHDSNDDNSESKENSTGSSYGHGLPQTGEQQTNESLVVIGIIILATVGYVVLRKHN